MELLTGMVFEFDDQQAIVDMKAHRILLECEEADCDEKRAYRIVYVSDDQTLCYIVQLNINRGLPFAINGRQLKRSILSGMCSVVDPKGYERRDCLDPSEKQKERARELYNNLRELIKNEPDCFIPSIRSKMLSVISRKTGLRRDTLYMALRRYWQYGKTPLSMIPDYAERGRKKNSSVSNENEVKPIEELGRKRGRRSAKHVAGVPGEAFHHIFHLLLSTHPLGKHKRKLRALYEYMIRAFFLGADHYDVPSYKQFLYFKNNHFRLDYIKNLVGGREFTKRYRPLTADFMKKVSGPGSQFEVDATIADAFVIAQLLKERFVRDSKAVSDEDFYKILNMVIGRPVIYAVRDSFSRVTVGLYIGLDGPGWMGVCIALDCAMTNMRSLLEMYQIDESELLLPDGMRLEDVFPCAGLPEKLLGDNEVFSSHELPQGLLDLGVDIETTPIHRPDLKPEIERYFGQVQEKVKPFMPSMPCKPEEQRLVKDPRKRACMTMREYVVMMLNTTIQLNTRVMEHYPLTQEMIVEGVQPTPVEIWNWGIKRKTGRLNRPSLEQFRCAVLKKKEVCSCRYGLRFYKTLYYTCSRAEAEGWFYREAEKKKVNLLYDPRKMDEVYFIDKEGEVVTCTMTERSSRLYAGLGYDEIIHLTRFLEVEIFGKKFEQIQSDEFDEAMIALVKEAKKRGKADLKYINEARKISQDEERESSFMGMQGLNDQVSKEDDTISKNDACGSAEGVKDSLENDGALHEENFQVVTPTAESMFDD